MAALIRVTAPVELPDEILDRVRALCTALTEVAVRVDESIVPTRSTAYSFDVRRRSFCLVVAVADPSGAPAPRLVLRAEPDDLASLLAVGPPFYVPHAGAPRLGVLLTADTDWDEIRELVVDSYRVIAPKKLIARIDDH